MPRRSRSSRRRAPAGAQTGASRARSRSAAWQQRARHDRSSAAMLIPLPFDLVQILKVRHLQPDSRNSARFASWALAGRSTSSSAATALSRRRRCLSPTCVRARAPTCRAIRVRPPLPICWRGAGEAAVGRSNGQERNGNIKGLYLGAGPCPVAPNHSTFDAQLASVDGRECANAVMPIRTPTQARSRSPPSPDIAAGSWLEPCRRSATACSRQASITFEDSRKNDALNS